MEILINSMKILERTFYQLNEKVNLLKKKILERIEEEINIFSNDWIILKKSINN